MAPKKEGSIKSAKIGNLYLQVLSAGSSDAPPGLLLFCERNEACGYLINCGEGTQRFCTEHKVRLAGKLRRALFTRMTWDELGGLPGMLLTMASSGHASGLHLYGAPALPRLVNNFCHFMPKAAIPHSTHAVRTGQAITFEESGIVATPIVIRPDGCPESCWQVAARQAGVPEREALGDETAGGEALGDNALGGEAAGGEALESELAESASKRQRLEGAEEQPTAHEVSEP